jgi:transposase-like protein
MASDGFSSLHANIFFLRAQPVAEQTNSHELHCRTPVRDRVPLPFQAASEIFRPPPASTSPAGKAYVLDQITPCGEPRLDGRALAALANTRDFSTLSLRLLLRTKELILLGKGLALDHWRESRDPVAGTFAEHCQLEIKIAELREELVVIRGRLLRMPPSQRKRYTPEERFQIVVFARTYGLTLQEAANTFLVDAGTMGRWIREAIREPDRNTVGSLLKATPPVRSFDDVTRQLVALLDSELAAANESRKCSFVQERGSAARQSGDIEKNPPAPKTPMDHATTAKPLSVRAKEPNHAWMTDITDFLECCHHDAEVIRTNGGLRGSAKLRSAASASS